MPHKRVRQYLEWVCAGADTAPADEVNRRTREHLRWMLGEASSSPGCVLYMLVPGRGAADIPAQFVSAPAGEIAVLPPGGAESAEPLFAAMLKAGDAEALSVSVAANQAMLAGMPAAGLLLALTAARLVDSVLKPDIGSALRWRRDDGR